MPEPKPTYVIVEFLASLITSSLAGYEDWRLTAHTVETGPIVETDEGTLAEPLPKIVMSRDDVKTITIQLQRRDFTISDEEFARQHKARTQ